MRKIIVVHPTRTANITFSLQLHSNFQPILPSFITHSECQALSVIQHDKSFAELFLVHIKMLVNQQAKFNGIQLLCKSKEEGTIMATLKEKRKGVRHKFYGFK